MTTAINIADHINAATGKPFGPKFDGTITIRRPSLHDKKNIALQVVKMMSTYGSVDPDMINDGMRLTIHAFAYVNVLNEGDIPDWFDMDKIYDEDGENAVLEVWSEVAKFLNSFRSKNNGDTGQPGSEQPSLLVQEQV